MSRKYGFFILTDFPDSQYLVCRRDVTRGSVLQQPDNEFFDTTKKPLEKYLIKWLHASYLHVSWETEKDLLELVGSIAKVCVSVYVCVCVFVFECACVCAYVSMCVCMCVSMYVCMYVCMYVYYVCMYACMYACVYVCMYICLYICMYICVCVYECMYV